MKFNPEDLPVCEKVITGNFYFTKEGDKIEKGDLIQIIAPKSMYHKFICIFEQNYEYGINIIYKSINTETKDTVINEYSVIDPLVEYLTWADFKFVKLNSLEEAEK